MKQAQQWAAGSYIDEVNKVGIITFIKNIQADAIRHCAKIIATDSLPPVPKPIRLMLSYKINLEAQKLENVEHGKDFPTTI